MFGWLYDYRTAIPLRPARASERQKGLGAETASNPLGVFDDDDGEPVYVGDPPEVP